MIQIIEGCFVGNLLSLTAFLGGVWCHGQWQDRRRKQQRERKK